MGALLELHDVAFSYPGGAPILEAVSLRLEPGERLALLGANGAGKSTIFQLAVGLLRPTAGRIVAFGCDRRTEADFKEVRRRCGLVFQDPDDQLFCPTVAEDVAFGPLNLGHSKDEAAAIVDTTLARLQLGHLRERATHRLSGGEKRLVSLAAVLAMAPEVLLLDEPTNALDEATTDRLVGILGELPQALLVTTHDAHVRRRLAERELRIESGRLEPYRPRCKHAHPPAARPSAA